MDEKPSAAEQAFEEWWNTEYGWLFDGQKAASEAAYLAATERTARRCVEICDKLQEDMEFIQARTKALAYMEASETIAKEFGLD